MSRQKRGRPPIGRTGIGERLYILRSQLGLTTQQAGERWGVTGDTISRYELGKTSIPLGVLIHIADRENITTDWILGRTDERRMS